MDPKSRNTLNRLTCGSLWFIKRQNKFLIRPTWNLYYDFHRIGAFVIFEVSLWYILDHLDQRLFHSVFFFFIYFFYHVYIRSQELCSRFRLDRIQERVGKNVKKEYLILAVQCIMQAKGVLAFFVSDVWPSEVSTISYNPLSSNCY